MRQSTPPEMSMPNRTAPGGPTDERRPHRLLPEEDAIGDPDNPEDDQDDTLPADLWYRGVRREECQVASDE